MCCFSVSLKGLAYFGASIHIRSGFVYMGKFLDVFIFLASNPKINQSWESCFVTLGCLLYAGLQLPLSALIFLGVEKDCIPLLTWVPIAYFLLQVSGFLLRTKYGVMVIVQQQLDWRKEEYLIPDSLEKITEDLFFGFLCTTFHLLVLFFLVQNIEKSVQGQVLDASPGYSVTFHPHPIQPPSRWPFHLNSHHNSNNSRQEPYFSRRFSFSSLRNPVLPSSSSNNNTSSNGGSGSGSNPCTHGNYSIVRETRPLVDSFDGNMIMHRSSNQRHNRSNNPNYHEYEGEDPPPYQAQEISNNDTMSTSQMSQQTFVVQHHQGQTGGDEGEYEDLDFADADSDDCVLDGSEEPEVEVRMPLLPFSTSRRRSSVTMTSSTVNNNSSRQTIAQ